MSGAGVIRLVVDLLGAARPRPDRSTAAPALETKLRGVTLPRLFTDVASVAASSMIFSFIQ
jgi:hypothetical protein